MQVSHCSDDRHAPFSHPSRINLDISNLVILNWEWQVYFHSIGLQCLFLKPSQCKIPIQNYPWTLEKLNARYFHDTSHLDLEWITNFTEHQIFKCIIYEAIFKYIYFITKSSLTVWFMSNYTLFQHLLRSNKRRTFRQSRNTQSSNEPPFWKMLPTPIQEYPLAFQFLRPFVLKRSLWFKILISNFLISKIQWNTF